MKNKIVASLPSREDDQIDFVFTPEFDGRLRNNSVESDKLTLTNIDGEKPSTDFLLNESSAVGTAPLRFDNRLFFGGQ